MKSTQYIESGRRFWFEFAKLAESEGFGFDWEKISGLDRKVFYVPASDGKTWVCEEPTNRLMADQMVVTKSANCEPLYTKTVKEVEAEFQPTVITVSAANAAKYAAALVGRETWTKLSDVTALRVYEMPDGTFVQA
jgi:hypothetical protein